MGRFRDGTWDYLEELRRLATPLLRVERADLVEDPARAIATLKADVRSIDPAVRWCVARRLREVNPAFHARDTSLLELTLGDPVRAVRQESISVLGLLSPELPPAIVRHVVDRVLCDDASVVHEDGRVLLAVHSVTSDADAVVSELLGELDDPDPYVRAGIETRLRALAHFDSHRAVPVFEKGLADEAVEVREAVAGSLALATWKDVESLVDLALEDGDLDVRRLAFDALLADRLVEAPVATIDSMRAALASGDVVSRMIAAWGLSSVARAAPEAAAVMYELALCDPDANVRAWAEAAVREMARRDPSLLEILMRSALWDPTAFRAITFSLSLRSIGEIHPALGEALVALSYCGPVLHVDFVAEIERRLAAALVTWADSDTVEVSESAHVGG